MCAARHFYETQTYRQLSTSGLPAVAECKPALDDHVLSNLVDQLNSTDQLSSFCKALREQFCQLVS